MDALDVAILRAMGVRPYERTPKPLDALHPSRLARATGSGVTTVKERLARMTDEGVLAGYHAVPNLRHLGMRAEAHYFQFADDKAKDAALPGILEIDGLLEVHDFLGRGLCADIAFRDEDELAARLRVVAEGATDTPPRRFYARDMPQVQRALTPLDWRVLKALRADPRAGAAEIASALGVSSRTVKRHLTRMAAEGSVFLVPILDPSKASGLFVFELLTWLREGSGPEPMAALRREFHAEHIYAYVPASAELGSFDMLLFAKTSADVESLRHRAESVAGVVRAEAWLFRSFLDRSAWIDAAIDAQLAAAPTL